MPLHRSRLGFSLSESESVRPVREVSRWNGQGRWSVANKFNSAEAYGCFLLPRINLWALKGPIDVETAFQRKMNYKAGSLPGKYDYKQRMVPTLFMFHFVSHIKRFLNWLPYNSFVPVRLFIGHQRFTIVLKIKCLFR